MRKWNLWGYVDESHVAQSVALGARRRIDGADSFIIAAADTVMRASEPRTDGGGLPGRARGRHVSGNDTLLDIPRRAKVLGYDPQFSWRELF